MMILFIFAGGMVGALSRHQLSKSFNSQRFPYGTLLANLSGGLLLGGLIRVHEVTPFPDWLWYLLATGFCGGYTTYSTFSYELLQMFETHQWKKGVSYLLISVFTTLLGVAMIWMI